MRRPCPPSSRRRSRWRSRSVRRLRHEILSRRRGPSRGLGHLVLAHGTRVRVRERGPHGFDALDVDAIERLDEAQDLVHAAERVLLVVRIQVEVGALRHRAEGVDVDGGAFDLAVGGMQELRGGPGGCGRERGVRIARGAPSECARREIARSRGTTRATRDGDGAVERPVVDAATDDARARRAARATRAATLDDGSRASV